eukprot:TRINITY_DN18971_c0_g1_i1.p1 TRINITY_DN18971_c0_g1~~TRINITY_DN18971_c0_g1_i1.p1  ORF type:complete len:563 (+),score=112.88 TRINITY_DN18971_c0_g1_i1:86-1690(+)
MLRCKTLVHTTEVARALNSTSWYNDSFELEIRHERDVTALHADLVFALYEHQSSRQHFLGQASFRISSLLERLQQEGPEQIRQPALVASMQASLPLLSRTGTPVPGGKTATLVLSMSMTLPLCLEEDPHTVNMTAAGALALSDAEPAVHRRRNSSSSRGGGTSIVGKGQQAVASRRRQSSTQCGTETHHAAVPTSAAALAVPHKLASSRKQVLARKLQMENARNAQRLAAIRGIPVSAASAKADDAHHQCKQSNQSSNFNEPVASIRNPTHHVTGPAQPPLILLEEVQQESEKVADLRKRVAAARARSTHAQTNIERLGRAVLGLENHDNPYLLGSNTSAGPRERQTIANETLACQQDAPQHLKDLQQLQEVLVQQRDKDLVEAEGLTREAKQAEEETKHLHSMLAEAERQHKLFMHARHGDSPSSELLAAQQQILDLKAEIGALQCRKYSSDAFENEEEATLDVLQQLCVTTQQELTAVALERDALKTLYDQYCHAGEQNMLKDSLAALDHALLYLMSSCTKVLEGNEVALID